MSFCDILNQQPTILLSRIYIYIYIYILRVNLHHTYTSLLDTKTERLRISCNFTCNKGMSIDYNTSDSKVFLLESSCRQSDRILETSFLAEDSVWLLSE